MFCFLFLLIFYIVVDKLYHHGYQGTCLTGTEYCWCVQCMFNYEMIIIYRCHRHYLEKIFGKLLIIIYVFSYSKINGIIVQEIICHKFVILVCVQTFNIYINFQALLTPYSCKCIWGEFSHAGLWNVLTEWFTWPCSYNHRYICKVSLRACPRKQCTGIRFTIHA